MMATSQQSSKASQKPFFGPDRPPDTNAALINETQGSTFKPEVVVLSLEKEPYLEESCRDLFTELRARADVHEITDAAEASAYFNNEPVEPGNGSIVLATDAALAKGKFLRQRSDAAIYVRDGGTLVFGLHFASFARPSDIKSMFQAFSLPWESGEYHRTEFSVNNAFQTFGTADLVPRYGQKALHLQNVARQDAVYLPTASSYTQSRVFAPGPVGDRSQTPVAFGPCGLGKVGYVGDVNSEEETTPVVLAMCGLLG